MEKTNVLGSTVAVNKGVLYHTDLQTGPFHFIADEPVAYGGAATGPSPIDFLCMSLASCKAITVRMYAARKGWKLEEVDVKVNFVKADATTASGNTFYCEVKLTGELDAAQRKRMLEIAQVCPVERLLGKENTVMTTMVK
ncbi:OsmC family protein [Flavisolibacter sp. BT320]|nr:OsmC family protein [Flavisolibacter longurius]